MKDIIMNRLAQLEGKIVDDVESGGNFGAS
jgi:hypothetical protein